MNLGGLVLLGLLSVLAIVARRSLRDAAGPVPATQRRMLLGLAVALPILGLVLPRLPWKAAAAGLLLLAAVAIEILFRAFERHESATGRSGRG